MRLSAFKPVCPIYVAEHVHTRVPAAFPRWVALLVFGDGWHNNHHAFEYSARHGLEWWQVDVSWLVIRSLQTVGLAWDVKLPTAEAMAEKRLRPLSA